MNKSEVSKAKKILGDSVERTQVASVDGGGLCLTAHWVGGGQKLFYSLDQVEEWARLKKQNQAMSEEKTFKLDTGNDGFDEILHGDSLEEVLQDVLNHHEIDALKPGWSIEEVSE